MKIVASNSLTVSNVNDGTITHTAYSWSSDGTDRFTTVYPGENLFLDYDGRELSKLNDTTGELFIYPTNTNNTKTITLKPNTKYTVTVYARVDKVTSRTMDIFMVNDDGGTAHISKTNIPLDTTLHKQVFTFTTNSSDKQKYYGRFDINKSSPADSVTMYCSKMKLEEGDQSTPFVPAPTEDYANAYPMYMGTYSAFTQADSTNPADYTWSPMRGNDGQTAVVHWAYSDNADGTGFTTTDNSQRYIGHYSDYTQADSTDKTKYRWADRWAKIPEDIQADIDSKADQSLTQEQLNALNEKNQILETEMQAKASMEAFSDLEKNYQSFVKSNADDQAKAEADLVEAGRRIELVTTQFGGLAELKTFIDTYMSSSNEGLIIGKKDASSTIKVSSDRISMFSAGKEVMYISQGVININNGIFTTSVQIGKFRTEQYHLNADMNVIRYVGG